MALESGDINLRNFLKKFTYTGDPEPGTKTEIALVDFLKICSLLKIDISLRRLARI
jgi:hypothetical protein